MLDLLQLVFVTPRILEFFLNRLCRQLLVQAKSPELIVIARLLFDPVCGVFEAKILSEFHVLVVHFASILAASAPTLPKSDLNLFDFGCAYGRWIELLIAIHDLFLPSRLLICRSQQLDLRALPTKQVALTSLLAKGDISVAHRQALVFETFADQLLQTGGKLKSPILFLRIFAP